MTEVQQKCGQNELHFEGNNMDMTTLLLLWCGIQLLSLSICTSGTYTDPLCEVSVYVFGTKICYWLKRTRQDARAGEAKCKLDNGSLAYIPNENALLVATAFVTQQLGTWAFAFVGYMITPQRIITVQETGSVQSWVEWDTQYQQPDNNGECMALFTQTGKFHDSLCTVDMYALCSTLYIPETTTSVPTTEITTDVTTDAISFRTTDINVDITTSACNCDCDASRTKAVYPVVNITKELQTKLDNLKKETEVNEETLSSTIRSKTSASDPRPSSAYVGYLGIALLTVIFGGIILMDLPRVIMTLKPYFGSNR